VLPFARPGESVVAVVALLLIVLMCRWVFAPTHTHVHAERPADYGLLVPVAASPTAADAEMLRDVLVAEGIRASVGAGHEVLVFAEDLDRARALVG
jgi:hypothetical protein